MEDTNLIMKTIVENMVDRYKENKDTAIEDSPNLQNLNTIIKYPMQTKTEKPIFDYLVRDNMEFDYYLFDNFNDAIRQAEKMSLSSEYSGHILIYENYFNNKTREWFGNNTFDVIEGEIFYDKHANADLHIEFYINAGEWLNPNEKWIDTITKRQSKVE